MNEKMLDTEVAYNTNKSAKQFKKLTSIDRKQEISLYFEESKLFWFCISSYVIQRWEMSKCTHFKNWRKPKSLKLKHQRGSQTQRKKAKKNGKRRTKRKWMKTERNTTNIVKNQENMTKALTGRIEANIGALKTKMATEIEAHTETGTNTTTGTEVTVETEVTTGTEVIVGTETTVKAPTETEEDRIALNTEIRAMTGNSVIT